MVVLISSEPSPVCACRLPDSPMPSYPHFRGERVLPGPIAPGRSCVIPLLSAALIRAAEPREPGGGHAIFLARRGEAGAVPARRHAARALPALLERCAV